MKLTRPIKQADINKSWYIVDAKNVRLGKLATTVAGLLIGKHKTTKTTNMPNGDAVIIVNSKAVSVHKSKLTKKKYYSHSGYIGGLKEVTLEKLLESNPNRLVEKAVKGMLPKNKLGQELFKNLFVYEETNHPHQAQQPISIQVK